MGTSYWDSAVRALVHLGRHPLASAYGLVVPDSIDAERNMWQLLAAFSVYPYDPAWSDQLDVHRLAPASSEGDSVDGGSADP
jgi:hypothetical protein